MIAIPSNHSHYQESPEPLIRSSIQNIPKFPVFLITSRHDLLNLQLHHPEPFLILSSPAAGAAFGLPWWLETVQNHKSRSILDCGTSAPLARMALLNGIGAVICQTSPAQRTALLTDPNHTHHILSQRPPLTPYPQIP